VKPAKGADQQKKKKANAKKAKLIICWVCTACAILILASLLIIFKDNLFGSSESQPTHEPTDTTSSGSQIDPEAEARKRQQQQDQAFAEKKRIREEKEAEAKRKREAIERIAREKREREERKKQDIINNRRAHNNRTLTAKDYGLSFAGRAEGFRSGINDTLKKCEHAWRYLPSDDPLKHEKLWAVAIYLYTSKCNPTDKFYAKLNWSLRVKNDEKYHKYRDILKDALYCVIAKQTRKAKQFLYRGISLPKNVANDYRRNKYKNFERSQQFESFTETFRTAQAFALGNHNPDRPRNNEPVVLSLDIKTSNQTLAYIERYGIKGETEWLAVPGMIFTVKGHSDTQIPGGYTCVKLSAEKQRRRLAMEMHGS